MRAFTLQDHLLDSSTWLALQLISWILWVMRLWFINSPVTKNSQHPKVGWLMELPSSKLFHQLSILKIIDIYTWKHIYPQLHLPYKKKFGLAILPHLSPRHIHVALPYFEFLSFVLSLWFWGWVSFIVSNIATTQKYFGWLSYFIMQFFT